MSAVEIPFPNSYSWQVQPFKAIIIGDAELWTTAFVRDCYKQNDFKYVQELPHYMIQLISKWVCVEMVHLLDMENGGHWKIELQHILQKKQLNDSDSDSDD